MRTQLKRSKITHWWIAEVNSNMNFYNFLAQERLSENLIVVGYYGLYPEELVSSTERVVAVTKNGVITERGVFYSLKEAHELYLQFLIEANRGDTLIATNWDYASKWSKSKIVADIIRDGSIENGVTFDFTPNRKYNVMFAGYSKSLSSNVIIMTFAKRNNCIKIGVSDSVKTDVYRSSITIEEETLKKVVLIQHMIEEKFK